MRIALLHYAAPPIVGGVEKIIAAHAGIFRRGGHEVRIIARQGDADILLEGGASYGKLKSVLADAEMVLVHNLLTMPFDMELTATLWQLAADDPRKRWIAWIHDLAA